MSDSQEPPVSPPQDDEVRRRLIEDERRQYEEAMKARTPAIFFKTFALHFPAREETSHFENMTQQRGLSHTRFAEFLTGVGYSERFLAETPAQFYATLLTTSTELGIDPEIIRDLHQRTYDNHRSDADGTVVSTPQDFPSVGTHMRFYEAVAPIYFRMREIGYNRHELVDLGKQGRG
jgi:hypothetical protein